MRFSFKILSGVGTCLGLGIGTLYLHANPVKAVQNDGRPLYDCPYLKWDYNWDNLQRFKVNKGEKSRDNTKDSKYSRTIWLVNDVQHNRAKCDFKQKPTSIGKLQARLCAATLQRLNKAGIKWDTVYFSTMVRTGLQVEMMKKALGDNVTTWKSTELLIEGLPVEVSPKAPDMPAGKEFSKVNHVDLPRVEAAFRAIFYRPGPDQKKNTNDLVLTHSNVIRYFVCRALQMPPEASSRFTLNHASITKIRIDGNGFVTVEGIGDTGFLPPTLLTSGEIGGAPPVLIDIDSSRKIHKKGFRIDSSVTENEFLRLLGDYDEHAKAANAVS